MSLLTHVPINEALAVMVQRLQEDDTLLEWTPALPEDIHVLAEVCLKIMYFWYQDSYSEQIEGSLQPKLWCRYIDDTFYFCDLAELPSHFNGIKPSTQFTMEEEENRLHS